MPAPTANIKFTADNADLLAKMRQAESSVGSVDSRVGGLSNTFRQLAGTVGAYLTVQEALRLSNLGESFNNARREFGKYIEDVEAGTARLRQATKNQVDDLKLYQLANESFRKGLSLTTIETAFQFAELQADQARDTIEGAFSKITTALSATEQGVGRAGRQLVNFGIYATDATGILEKMNAQLLLAADNFDDSSDAVAQFETNWTNASIKIGQSVRQFLLPALEAVSRILTEDIAGSEGQVLATISANLKGFDQGNFGSPAKIESILTAVADLRQSVVRGTASLEDYENLLLLINSAAADPALNGYTQDLAAASAEIERLMAARTKPLASAIGEYGPGQKEYEEFLELQAQQQTEAEKAAAQAARDADQLRREQLAQAREEVKIRISLGQATYADLGSLLSEQEALNKGFLARDKAAYLAWLTDRAAVYQNDKANAAKAESEKYNEYQRYVEDILVADSLTQEERYRMATEAIDFQLANENFDLERRRQLVNQKRAIESEYQQYLLQNYQQQLELLNNLFGQPALQLVDQFFASGEVRFEEFLKNILRMAARYALQAALFSIFGTILGGVPLVGGALGGTTGGGFLGGGGILSVPTIPNLVGGLPDLSGLNFRSFPGTTGPGSSSPSFAQATPQVTVQILATPDQLAALVATGNHQRDRSNLSD